MIETVKSAATVCPAQCRAWGPTWVGLCVCSTKEGVSLVLGFISVLSWGVAEIPQIVTNFNSKSTEGLSFAFLLTWIIGDFFNLFGCLLEPATLPTQFYMALLYTVTTLTLTLQSVYYGYIYPRLKSDRHFLKDGKPIQSHSEAPGLHGPDGSYSGDLLRYGQLPVSSMTQSSTTMSSPIPLPSLPRSHSADQDSYYMSARSLTTSHTPTRSSFLTPRTFHMLADVEDSVDAPLLGGSLPNEALHPSKTKNLRCVVSALTLIVGSLGTFSLTSSKVKRHGLVFDVPNTGVARHESRKLLQVNHMILSDVGGHATIGTYLGWAMAAIYMGGRLPQICLNMRRGNVDGLNPLMFIFALLGNTTYVASILVNSLDWSRIMPNMPWLVDAGGCALLDTFILLQFIYFSYRQSRFQTYH
ncbi:hypothetical protein vseg_020565 [Gypsophila vaccaria]